MYSSIYPLALLRSAFSNVMILSETEINTIERILRIEDKVKMNIGDVIGITNADVYSNFYETLPLIPSNITSRDQLFVSLTKYRKGLSNSKISELLLSEDEIKDDVEGYLSQLLIFDIQSS